MIQETGGSDGIRDEKLLESAIETSFQSFGGEELYPIIQAKAARLCYGLVKNHPMIDGNKRIGTHVMLVFLMMNGYELKYTQKELADTIFSVDEVIKRIQAGNFEGKEFTVPDMFTDEEWSQLDRGNAGVLGKNFYNYIADNPELGIYFVPGKTIKRRAVYTYKKE